MSPVQTLAQRPDILTKVLFQSVRAYTLFEDVSDVTVNDHRYQKLYSMTVTGFNFTNFYFIFLYLLGIAVTLQP
jgi:hypothetical protein